MPEPRVSDAFMTALRSGDADALAGHLVNELQEAAVSLRPSLGALLDAGREGGALSGLVSGSGPTCAFLVRDADHAVDLAAALTVGGLPRAVRIAHGPVPGARVITG
jgi:4-diphosphocytidyl-2-C-methyl-D-erythritol kinase